VWLFALAWLNQATPGQDHQIYGQKRSKILQNTAPYYLGSEMVFPAMAFASGCVCCVV
jgi:hypothetical protein